MARRKRKRRKQASASSGPAAVEGRAAEPARGSAAEASAPSAPALDVVALAPPLLAAAAGFGVLGMLRGLGPVRLAGTDALYDPGYACAAIVLGCGLAALGLLQRRVLALVPVGVLLALFALGVLEDRSAVAAYHRAVMRPLGFLPDLWLVLACGALIAADDRQARSLRVGVALLATSVLAWLLLSPASVAGELTTGILGASGDPVDGGARLGRPLLPWLNAAAAGAFLVLVLDGGLRRKLPAWGPLALLGAWSLGTGLLGAEGWVHPLWSWPQWLHAPTRALVLCAAAAATAAVLTVHVSPDQPVVAKVAAGAFRFALPLAVAASAVFVLAGWQSWHWSKTDENVYFYAAHALRDGLLPYRDFFYGHPPLRVLVPAFVFLFGGFTLIGSQLMATAGALGAGLCVWRIAARVTGGRGGEVAGLLALVFFLGGERVLIASTETTGVNMATGFACLALLLAYAGRPVAAALASVAAIGVGMVQVWMLAVVALVVLLHEEQGQPAQAATAVPTVLGLRLSGWRPFVMRFVPALGAGALLVFGGGWLVGGADFVTEVFTYHTLKPPSDAEYTPLGANPLHWPGAVLTDLALLFGHGALRTPANNNALAWLGACVGPAVAMWWMGRGAKHAEPVERRRRLAVGLPLLFGLVLSLVFYALLRERYDYYWAAFMPIPAVLAALALVRVGALVVTRPSALAAAALVALLLPTHVLAYWGAHVGAEAALAGKQGEYEFRVSAPSQTFDGLTASLLYKPHWVRAELESPLDRMFWAKKRVLSVADDMAQTVLEHTPAGSPITGSSTVAPLVALLAGRRMAANEVDTNSKTFRTGLRDEGEFWRRVCEDGVSAVVAGTGFFPLRYMRGPNPVRGQFRLQQTYFDQALRYGRSYRFELWTLEPGRERCEPTGAGSGSVDDDERAEDD